MFRFIVNTVLSIRCVSCVPARKHTMYVSSNKIHSNYYFPFGNEEWIWAQAGRHWKKDGSVSLTSDKGCDPFIPEDHIKNCETRVGKSKEKCWVDGIERKRCYKTCGFFMPDDKFCPGEERQKIFGW